MTDKLTDAELAEIKARLSYDYAGDFPGDTDYAKLLDHIAALTKERDLAQSVALMHNEVREKLERQLEAIKGRLTEAVDYYGITEQSAKAIIAHVLNKGEE